MKYKGEDRRISVLGSAILAGVTVIAGLVVYTIMQRQAEFILGATLELSLQSRVSQFETEIGNGLKDFITIATRPYIIQQVKRFNEISGDSEARLALQRAAISFIPTGLSALAISGADDKEIASAGVFSINVELQAPIATPYKTRLLWKDGFVLSSQIGVFDHGKQIGSIRAEERMASLSRMLFDAMSLGKSGELVVCTPRDSDMLCFPTTLLPAGIKRLTPNNLSNKLPMSHALAGKSGVINAIDYRSQAVVAAYKPVGSTGLGMVLKLDRAELYLPIKHQLKYVIPMIMLLVAVGVLLLNWLVAPLLRKLVQSEDNTKLINTELSNSETRLRAIFDSVDDGIITINSSGIVESVNPAIERIFGYKKQEIIGQNISMLMPEQERGNHDEAISRYITTRQPHVIGIAGREVTARRKDGSTPPIEIRLSEMKLESGQFFIATLRDISARKEAENRVIHLATHDPLTDLPNRNLLKDRIDQAIAQAKRRDTKVAVLFLDLDGFKVINDTRGHDFGDQLLVEIAQRIKRALRDEDTVARQGGDEFIVAMPNIENVLDIEAVAKNLLNTVSMPYLIQGQHLATSVSIGISLYPENGDNAETLIKNSDAAMYNAKNSGRNKYIFLENRKSHFQTTLQRVNTDS